MNIRDIFITLRYKISYGSTVEWYNFWYIVLRKKRKIIPQVASIDETIRKIIDDRCSVSRFGDGEVLLTSPDKEIRFQKGDPLLAKRLTEVLQSHEEGLYCLHLRRIPRFVSLQSQKSPVLENSFLSVRFLVGPFAGSGTKIL